MIKRKRLTFQDLTPGTVIEWRSRRAEVEARNTSHSNPSRHYVTCLVAGGVRLRLTRLSMQSGAEQVFSDDVGAEQGAVS